MSSLLFIIDLKGDYYFDLFYLLAFLFSFVWLVAEGYKRRFNFVSWMLVLACSRFLFIVGTKVFTYSSAQWQAFFTEFYLPPTSDKILFGGLLLSLAGYWPLKKLLSLKHDAVDAFAIMLPIGIGVQRFGCWLAGCCHGEVTTLPWGMQYLPGTLPHYHQFEAGLLQPNQIYSLPVHPVQLYEVVASVLVVGILLLVRRRVKAAGSLFMLSLLLYGFFRFFIEFYREAAAHAAGGAIAGNLKVVQWIILIMIAVLGAVVLYRERKFCADQQDTPAAPAPDLLTALVLLLTLVTASWSLRNWFTYAELVAINMAVYPAIALAGVHIFRTVTVPRYRWLTASVLVLPLLLMSQTFPTEPADSAQVSIYHTVRVGYGSGDYSSSLGYKSGCGHVPQQSYFHQEYKAGAAGYAITKQKGSTAFTYGLNAFRGSHTETNVTDPAPGQPNLPHPVNDMSLWGFNPYVRLDGKWFGLGGGVHLGRLFYTTDNVIEEKSGYPESGGKKKWIYPELFLRAGPTKYFFGEMRLGNHFPAAFPGLRFQMGFGSGFGLGNGSYLRGGTTYHDVNSKFYNDVYLAGNIVIGRQFVLEPLYLWGKPRTANVEKHKQFSLGLHYRFYKQ